MTKRLENDAMVVLGGSFNPPTTAHEQLMVHAMEQSGATSGLFVPSSDAYVRRKCDRLKEPMCFSERARYMMLQEIASRHPEMAVWNGEFGDDGRGHTYDTMCRIQEIYKDRQLAFLVGSDKLRILPRWHNAESFMDRFWFVVTARNGDDVERLMGSNPMLARHADKFIVIPELPDRLVELSSTRARVLLKMPPSEKNDAELEDAIPKYCIPIARRAMKGEL
ncbi:MAG: nicotinate-nicotinamide nucleotide adenylyltransferase [Clostridia bacterium]|nr:nicotinate-nicotinamide nucleotide adenylyltransferase [Clostridia bacterium]